MKQMSSTTVVGVESRNPFILLRGIAPPAPTRCGVGMSRGLPAPIRGMFLYLYMIMNVYSRKIVGLEVHPMESAELGASLVHKAVMSEGCLLAPTVLHADNGSPQKGFTMNAKLEALGVTPSYSRPRVSNDNPFSEALFRTIKYRQEYPVKGFDRIEAARQWVGLFVKWYNEEHLHSAIRYVTPSQRHNGEDTDILTNRQRAYQKMKQRRKERWSGSTRNWEPITKVWLDCPKDAEANVSTLSKCCLMKQHFQRAIDKSR
jgi:transposase InsO family protein